MEFLKARFKKCQKPNEERELENKEAPPVPVQESKSGNEDGLSKANAADSAGDTEEDDDDDFIMNEVKRRLKELRNKSFMMLIPEESCPEDEEEEEEEEETSSSEWRESEAEDKHPWFGFDSFYEKYCERMLFFDKMSARLLQEAVPGIPLNPSPRSASKKLALSLRSLSFKKQNDIQEDSEQLQLQDDPYQDLETTYVAQICLSWEALHIQYMQLNQIISSQQENTDAQEENITSYSYAAQQFQQFQVLLQRFIENEPFEQGHRVELFSRIRNSLPKLLQVPNFQGPDQRGLEGDSESPVFAYDLRKEIENAIMTFCLFLKSEKRKSGNVLNLFGGNNLAENSLQQIQTSLDKKEMRLKELRRKKGGKKKSWPTRPEQMELLFGLVDLKVVARVLRMAKITKEQLLWCEEKMSKIDVFKSRLQRDGFPVLFPC